MACKLYRLDLHGDGQSLGVLSVLLNQKFRNQWNHHEEKTERHCSIESKFLIEAIHLRFDRNFDYCLAKWDCKREFFEIIERQVSVNRTERSKRTISGDGPLWPENFHLGRSVPFISWSWPKIPTILAQWKATHIAKSCQRSDFGRRKKGHRKACKSVSARSGHKGWQLLFEKCLLQLRINIPS